MKGDFIYILLVLGGIDGARAELRNAPPPGTTLEFIGNSPPIWHDSSCYRKSGCRSNIKDRVKSGATAEVLECRSGRLGSGFSDCLVEVNGTTAWVHGSNVKVAPNQRAPKTRSSGTDPSAGLTEVLELGSEVEFIGASDGSRAPIFKTNRCFSLRCRSNILRRQENGTKAEVLKCVKERTSDYVKCKVRAYRKLRGRKIFDEGWVYGRNIKAVSSDEEPETRVASKRAKTEATMQTVCTECLKNKSTAGLEDLLSELDDALKSPLPQCRRISSRFNPNRHHPIHRRRIPHKGSDLAARCGSPVYATHDGIVEYMAWRGTFGRLIRIKHCSGDCSGVGTTTRATLRRAKNVTSLYAHLKGFWKGLRKGQQVKRGQLIGYAGSSGAATGCHLHFEVRENGWRGKARNPETLFSNESRFTKLCPNSSRDQLELAGYFTGSAP